MRHKASGLLRQLHQAYSSDKTAHKVDPSAQLVPLDEAQAAALEKEVETGEVDDRVENRAIRTGEVLRVHGIYMKKRREFEVRIGEGGRMELWDKVEQKQVT